MMGGVTDNGNGQSTVWLKPRFDSMPADIAQLCQFLVWRAQQRDSKWTKVPYCARTGKSGSSTDAQTWSSFEEAKAAYGRGGYTGIGVAMAVPLAGVDLDHCIDPETGKIAEWAMVIIRAFDSYAEKSPSGTGVRILFEGQLPGAGLNRTVKDCHIEIYDKGRFLTLTGHHIDGTPITIEPRQDAASQLYQWILDNTGTGKQSNTRPVIDPNQKGKDLTDSEVMECAMNAANGAKFEKLWDGDISDYIDTTHPEGNPSRADSAIVGLLCYHSLDDEQVERLWKGSKLFRDKLNRCDYVERTINFIRKNQTDVCSKALPKRNDKKSNVITIIPVALPKIVSEFDEVVLLVLSHLEPVVTEEDKLTLLALIGVFAGRKTAAISRGMLARRIRRLDEEGKIATGKTLDQFGGRRLDALKKALRRSLKIPVLTIIEHSKQRGFDKRTQKPKPSRYELDLEIFREALALARYYYDEWCDGKPRFKEWQGDKNYQPKPNPGKCREVAARHVAQRYSKLDKPEESEQKKTEIDDFSKWVGFEKTILRASGRWADAFDDLGKTTQERRVFAGRLLDQIKLILLQKDKLERRRMLLKLLQDSKTVRRGHTFMHEGMLSEGKKTAKTAPAESACSHYGVNTNGDMKDLIYERQLQQWRALGEISVALPRAAIWHNKDCDAPTSAIGIFDLPGPDGRLYVKTSDSAGGVPFDELEFLPSAAALASDPLVDAIIADEIDAEGF
jgi:hypothetical protein